VGHILVEHDTVKDLAVLENTTGDLLNLGVSLDIDLDVTLVVLLPDLADGVDSEVNDEVAPLGRELGANGGGDDLLEVLVVLKVDVGTNLVGDLDDLLKSLEVGVDNDGGMDVLFKETLDGGENLTGKDDDGSGTITDLLILGTSELNHGLGGGMLHINFTKNGIAIVGEDDTAHGVKEHLEHALGTEGGADDVSDGLGSLDVGALGLLALLTLGVGVENVDRSLHF